MERTENDYRYQVEYLETPVKSENDKKDYRVIRLVNGLTALLISDMYSKTDDSRDQDYERDLDSEKMAVCCLCVGVGCFSDPEIQDVANLLRHMICMESEKYSEEIDFKTFIKERFGSVDDSTDNEQTTFYFTVQEKHLLSALDRFAQGFINPLKKDTIIRERENIREYELVSRDENKKEEPLSCAQTDPVNKYIQDSFSSNKDDDKLCEELHKFRNRHYSAHRMTIVIQARLSLGTLEKFITKCFVDVPSNRLSPDDYEDNIPCVSFDTPDIERILIGTRSPISHMMFKQGDKLEVTWTIPLPSDFYKNKPHVFIAWIIGNGGKGSLTSYLCKKMPCCIRSGDNIQCNSETFLRYNCTYSVLKLTVVPFCEEHEHLKEILDAIFSFINLLKKEDPHKRTIYYDIYKIMEYNFRFINEKDSMDYIISLCKGMHFYPSRDYITANKLIYIEYNLEAIQKYLNYLEPETASITILRRKPCLFGYNEEHIYIEVLKEYIEHWKCIEPLPNFHLPLKNVFIASDFSLIPIIPAEVPKYPVKMYSDEISEIWYRPDPKFRLPKCYMNLQFVSPLGIQSPKNEIFMEMYCRALNLLLLEELYPAVIAGFVYYIGTSDKGIIIETNGFIEKLPRLLITIAKYMTDYPALVTKSLFELCKVQLLDKRYYTQALTDPHKLIEDVKLSILKFVHYTDVEKYIALSNVNFEEFQSFVKSFTDYLYVQCLVQGNITEIDAIVTIRECLETINCRPLLNIVQRKQMRVIQLPLGISYCKLKNIDEMNATSVVTNYYQFDVMSAELSVLLDLMMEIMNKTLHNWILDKTMEFKIVSCDSDYINGVLGYSITVNTEANKCTTEHMDKQIEVFLQLFNGILKDFEEMDLYKLKAKLLIEKIIHHYTKNLKEEVDRNWNEITKGEYVFDRYEREVRALKDIKMNNLKKCFAKHTENGSKLSIHVVGNDPEKIAVEKENIDPKTKHFTLEYISDEQQEIGNHYIVDVEAYKKNLCVYPLRAKI